MQAPPNPQQFARLASPSQQVIPFGPPLSHIATHKALRAVHFDSLPHTLLGGHSTYCTCTKPSASMDRHFPTLRYPVTNRASTQQGLVLSLGRTGRAATALAALPALHVSRRARDTQRPRRREKARLVPYAPQGGRSRLAPRFPLSGQRTHCHPRRECGFSWTSRTPSTESRSSTFVCAAQSVQRSLTTPSHNRLSTHRPHKTAIESNIDPFSALDDLVSDSATTQHALTTYCR